MGLPGPRIRPRDGSTDTRGTEACCLQIISGHRARTRMWKLWPAPTSSIQTQPSHPWPDCQPRPGQGPVSCMNDGERIDKQDTSFNNKISSPLLTSQLIKAGHKRAALKLKHHYLGMGQASEENLDGLAVYIKLFEAIIFPQNIPENRAELKICLCRGQHGSLVRACAWPWTELRFLCCGTKKRNIWESGHRNRGTFKPALSWVKEVLTSWEICGYTHFRITPDHLKSKRIYKVNSLKYYFRRNSKKYWWIFSWQRVYCDQILSNP